MTSDPGNDSLEKKADPKDHSLEALDEEIAEVKALLDKAFSAEKLSGKARPDVPRESAQIDNSDRLIQDDQLADFDKERLARGKAEDLAYIFGDDHEILEADGASAEDSADEILKSSLEDADAGNNRAENGALEEIELRQDSPALKAAEKKPISEMTPEELAAHIESFKKSGKKAGTAASYRAFGAAVSFLATIAAMIFFGYVCGSELAARTGTGWAMPACLVAGTVLGFVFGILVIRPLINERKA